MGWSGQGQEFWLQVLFAQILFALAAVLGLASRRYSRLALAQAFPWFSLFALSFSVYIWLNLAQHLHGFTEAWSVAAYTAAFLALWCAALQLLPHTPSGLQPRWVCMASFLLGGLWMAAYTYFNLDPERVLRLLTIALAFPAITATAYALRRHAQVHILPLHVPHLYRTLRTGGIALFLFGVLWLAERWFPLPYHVFWTLLQVLLLGIFAWAMMRGLEIFEVETRQRMEAMEISQARMLERQNIARELHDHAIQNVYAAGLMLQSLMHELPQAWQDRMERVLDAINTAHRQLRGLLLRLNTQEHDGEIDLAHALKGLVEETVRMSGANVVLRIDIPQTSWDARRAAHLLAFVREALSNAIRHAGSPRIEVRVSREGENIRVEVIDFGRGMSPVTRPGFGLRHMRDRALLLGGQLNIESRPSKGTRVVLTAPLQGV